MRKSERERKTSETDIKLTLDLDGGGSYDIDTGVGFLDHMLELFARHGRFDLDVRCRGDVHVDDHHSVEDIAIALGSAFDEALGERRGIRRYGSMLLPMDETLALAAVDISGRPCLVFAADFPTEKIGSFDTELVYEFMAALSRTLKASIHIKLLTGGNSHHIAEAIFKALARALREAISIDPDDPYAIPSTKGTL